MGDKNIIFHFIGVVVCEPPNNKLDTFIGVLFLKDNRYLLNNEKMLLRGCVLRNTEWCFGMVIFAGKTNLYELTVVLTPDVLTHQYPIKQLCITMAWCL